MKRYSLRRLAQAVLVAAIMSFVLYNMISLLPGDPIDLMLEGNPSLTPELVARRHQIYGTDQPVLLRYWRWLTTLASGDLGYSTTHFKPVMAILGPALIQTSKLMVLTFALSVILSIVLGCAAAINPGRWLDNVISFFAFA